MLLGLSLPALAMEKTIGWCEQGNQRVVTSGVNSTTRVQRSYPACTVDVFLTGTLTHATIYSTNISTPLTNPFTANANGLWGFYAANGTYDVQLSGAGIGSPFTLGAISLFDASTLTNVWTQTGENVTLTDGAASVSALKFLNQTATTGSTEALLVAGAGQGSGPILRVKRNDSNPDVGGIYTTAANVTAYILYPAFSASPDSAGPATSSLNYFTGLGLANSLLVRWSSDATWYGTADLALGRTSAGVLEINNGSPGVFRDLHLRNITIDGTCTGAGCGGGGTVTSVFGQTGAVNIPVTTTDISTPANPSAGTTKWYTKAGAFCSLSPAGVELCTNTAVGYNRVQDEGSNLTQRQIINFTGAGVTCSDMTVTTCDVPGGGAGATPPFADTTNIIKGVDTTKLLKIDLTALTTATTRTLRVQDASYFIAGIDYANIFTAAQQFNAATIYNGVDMTFLIDATSVIGATAFRPAMIFTRHEDIAASASGTALLTVTLTGTGGVAQDMEIAAGNTGLLMKNTALSTTVLLNMIANTTNVAASIVNSGGPGMLVSSGAGGSTAIYSDGSIVPGPAVFTTGPQTGATLGDNALTSGGRYWFDLATTSIHLYPGGIIYGFSNPSPTTYTIGVADTTALAGLTLYTSTTTKQAHWFTDATSLFTVASPVPTNILRVMNGGQVLINRNADDGSSAQLQFGGAGRAINISSGSAVSMVQIAYTGSTSGVPLVLTSNSTAGFAPALLISNNTTNAAPGSPAIQINNARISSQNGAPSGFCVNGSIYMRQDNGGGTSIYGCKGSAWVAMN